MEVRSLEKQRNWQSKKHKPQKSRITEKRICCDSMCMQRDICKSVRTWWTECLKNRVSAGYLWVVEFGVMFFLPLYFLYTEKYAHTHILYVRKRKSNHILPMKGSSKGTSVFHRLQNLTVKIQTLMSRRVASFSK